MLMKFPTWVATLTITLMILLPSFITCVDLTSLEKLDHLWFLHQSYLFIMCQDLFSSLQLTTSSSFKNTKEGPTTIFILLSFKKMSLWWGLLFSEHVNESVSKSVSLWARVWACEQEPKGIFQFIFHPCQLKYSLTNFDDMSKYTLTKIYSTTSIITRTLSLPCGFATWTPNNNIFVWSNAITKIYLGWCPMCWSKKSFWHIYPTPWFQTCPTWHNIIRQAYFALPHHSWWLSS
jgi:hypothetical protein